jgi:adhesin transport system outer membrane protein
MMRKTGKWISIPGLILALALPCAAGAQDSMTLIDQQDPRPTMLNGVHFVPRPESVPGGSLKDTVLSTLHFNPDIKAFQEYRQATEHDISRARSGWLPRVDARGGYGTEQWSNDQTRNNTQNRISQDQWGFYPRSEASIVLQQTIWDGLATWNRYQIGLSRRDSAVYRLLDNAEAASLDAILAHIEVYRQRRLVALSEINVQNHRDILASQEERQRLGASSLADVTQTRGRLARAEASLVDTRSALEIAVATYKRLTGKDPGPLEEPAPPLEAYPSMQAVLADAQTNNPKVKALQSDVETALSQVELDKANFHPQIYLEIGPTYNWQVQGSQTYEWGTGVMLRFSWNLFDGLYDWYNVKGDRARMRQTREQINSQTEDLARESAATWSTLLSAREQSGYFSAAVDNNTQTRDMYLQQFNVGQRSLLDVLDAENELYSSSMQLVTSRLNEIAAMYRLKALGGDLLLAMGVDKNGLNIDTDELARQRGE